MFVPATHDFLQDMEKFKVPMLKVVVHEPNNLTHFEMFDTFHQADKFIKNNQYAEKHPLICYDGYEINIYDYKVSDDYDFLLKEGVRGYITQVFNDGISRDSDKTEVNRMFAGILAFIHTNFYRECYMPVDMIPSEEDPKSWFEKLFAWLWRRS